MSVTIKKFFFSGEEKFTFPTCCLIFILQENALMSLKREREKQEREKERETGKERERGEKKNLFCLVLQVSALHFKAPISSW